ncbi:DUF3180 domain-containing protein [Nocardiopsis lambiniae]|uniref:DUF3180 domain-containing protein n=1 Tax=Nocardiopsis lambiniae TaxID=3075539 RepID=A0ABU2M3F5_9ACTN|nr:DUF3180 domain-containing protein [Nocardiopsis sp. DSM 44743]MDT0327179.1 DUF3180 domain-containing protein [Nocardiopsis sp. DSM 44743]
MTEEEERRLHPTGWRTPTLLAIAGALLGALFTTVLPGLPPMPWTAIPTLLLLALAEGFTAGRTRRRIRHAPGTEPIPPLSAARLVALAKASVLAASLFGGFFAGVAVMVVENLGLPVHREVFLTALGTALAAGVLVVAGLYLEYACRVPDDEDRDDDRPEAV